MPFCQKKLFFIGAWSNLACELGLTSLALALAPLSLLSPVSGLTIVFGAMFAWIGLWGTKKEKATPIEIVALCFTCVGVSVAASFGPSGEGYPDLLETSRRLYDWPHLVYAVVGFTISLGWLAVNTFDKRLGKYRPRPEHPISAPLSGFMSGWLASYSLTMFKVIMTALRRVACGDMEPTKYVIVWLCVVLLGPCSVSQIYSLNVTMGSGGTNYIFPCFAVCVIVLSATAGGMIFNEFARLPARDIALFWVGNSVTMVGLFVLAVFQSRRAALQKRDDEYTRTPAMTKSAAAMKARVDMEPSAADHGEVPLPVVAPCPRTSSSTSTIDVEDGPISAQPERSEPSAPEGYVRDPACYWMGIRLGCCNQPW